jgi:hypothetical protein
MSFISTAETAEDAERTKQLCELGVLGGKKRKTT